MYLLNKDLITILNRCLINYKNFVNKYKANTKNNPKRLIAYRITTHTLIHLIKLRKINLPKTTKQSLNNCLSDDTLPKTDIEKVLDKQINKANAKDTEQLITKGLLREQKDKNNDNK